MIYVGKHYQTRANQIVFDRISKTGYNLHLYTGTFPTYDNINATTLDNSTHTKSYYYQQSYTWVHSFNNSITTVAGFETKRVATTKVNYNDIKLTSEGVFFAFQTMRSLTAAIDGPITYFELVNQNRKYAGFRIGYQSWERDCTAVGTDDHSSMSGYASIYGLVGQVGTNNNITVSNQNVLSGEQFYIHDFYLKFDQDVAAIKTENPTIL